MSEQRNSEVLSEMLRELPREQASPTFTSDVLRRVRLEASEDRPSRFASIFFGSPHRVLVPLGAAFLLVAVFFGGREWQYQQERDAAIARFEALRVEHQALSEEIEQMRQFQQMRNAAQTKPVLHVGSSGDVDLVVDLMRLRGREGEAQPASYRPLSVGDEEVQTRPATYAW